jgi:DNA-binding transcriptional MocR family regulator
MRLDTFVQQLGNWSEEKGPLHHRLEVCLQRAIEHGLLVPSTRLPAERALATALALSRTTVLTAYNTLRTEGWLTSRPGSGTWVSSHPVVRDGRQRAQSAVLSGSPLLNLLQIDDSEVIDFAVGTTKPLAQLPRELFSLAPGLQDALLAERNYKPLGFPPLRDAVARHYTMRGLKTEASQILITAGAQQAIALATALYVQRGDTILLENPTYFGALDVFRLAGARLVQVTAGAQHVDPDEVRDRLLSEAPRLIYLTPTYQNPSGAVMPENAQRRIGQLAEEFSVPIVEDHTLGELTLEGTPPSPIAAQSSGDMVLTIGSMSKLFWAGLRIGWVRAPIPVITQLARLKTAHDMGSPSPTQAIATQLMGTLEKAKILRCDELRSKRDLMMQLLREHIPEWEFAVPSGGLFLWVKIPEHDSRYFAQLAARHGVAVTPGPLFAVDDGWINHIRIPFLVDEESINVGVTRLAAAWREFRGAAIWSERGMAPIV